MGTIIAAAWLLIVGGSVWLIGAMIAFSRGTHGLSRSLQLAVVFGPPLQAYLFAAILFLLRHIGFWLREIAER